MPEQPRTRWKYTWYAYAAVVGSWLVYAALTFLAPDAANSKYHMSETDLILLRLTVIIPIHLIWLIATRGAVAFKNYAAIIHGSRESGSIDQIANGLLWTVAYLVTLSVAGALEPLFMNSRWLDFMIVVRDHLPPLIGLVAFFLLYRGSHRLRTVANFTTWSVTTIWILAGFLVFSAAFVLEFATATVSSASVASRNSISFVPHWILLFTLILPYLASWFMGILAAINIYKFSRSVKGILYRQALRNLVLGIITVVIFAIAIQITTFANRFLANLSIGAALITVYSLIILYALGFVFIWIAARKLSRLEGLE